MRKTLNDNLDKLPCKLTSIVSWQLRHVSPIKTKCHRLATDATLLCKLRRKSPRWAPPTLLHLNGIKISIIKF